MRRKTLILCTTAMLLAWTGAAQAQVAETPGNDPATQEATTSQGTPDAESLSEAAEEEAVGADIVVTGFRESLASSRNLKRNATQVVDAVVADDIGKLPDLAVSDTASRIPGIQVIREAGEASRVLLRGLDEQFFNTTYNGREIFTAERRQVALQDFPSAGIAALEVFKTATANQIDPGVIGLTNVRSRRPFDIDGFELAGNVWGLHTAQAGVVTPNGNILISNRWDTGIGEVGVLLNASYTELEYLDSQPFTAGLQNRTINGQNVRSPGGQELFYRSGNRKRPSFNGSVQWRPTPELEFYVDGLYQGFRNEIDNTNAFVPIGDATSYSNITLLEGTNVVRSGTAVLPAGATIFSFRGGTFNRTDTYQIAGGAIYDSGPLRISADVARTNSVFNGSTESVDRRFGLNGYTVDFDTAAPQFSVNGFNAADPANYIFDGLYEEDQRAQGDDWQARLDGEYEFEDFFVRSVQLGVRYTTRDARRRFGNRFAGYGVGRGIPLSALPLEQESVRPGFKGSDIQGFRTFLAPTYESIRKNREALRQFVISNPRSFGFGTFTLDEPAANPGDIYQASEETFAGYGQINYNFGDIVDGTIGLRVVRTETSITGTRTVEGVSTPIETGPTFTDYLPNASLRWKITPQLQLRLSYTETRTKATFDQLRPTVTFGAPGPQLVNGQSVIARLGEGGNPNLGPIDSENYDASLEYYFSPTGFASVTAFRRDLRGFIQTQRSGLINDPALGPIVLNAPFNSRSGRIDGVEAQISTFFDFEGLPEFIKNFGIQANYTYLDAATDF